MASAPQRLSALSSPLQEIQQLPIAAISTESTGRSRRNKPRGQFSSSLQFFFLATG